jgi:PII-like signaling protein
VSAALQMRFHFGERDRDGDGPLDAAVMDACARHGVWAAALLRGVEGFGAKHLLRTDRLLSLSEDAPLIAVAVGETGTVEALAEEVRSIAAEGLLVLEEVETAPSGDLVRATLWGPRTGAESPHLRAVDALYRHGAEAATVLLGVDGVLDGERRRARFVAGNTGVPAMTVAVGERGVVTAALAELGSLANLVTFEAVAPRSRIARRKRHGGASPGASRVALLTSEATQCEHHPLYLEFIHALRREGARGATALRGVWGFRGDVAPHGDRVLALRRDVPVIVETIDTAERAGRWLEIAESLAERPDLMYRQNLGRTFALE